MPKVSVIIPIYNTENYIEKCLNSIVNQTLEDIEILLIDDGSSDNSLEIAREFQNRDERVKIFTQDHKKQGAARNLGINNAIGEYIGFIDSDDWVDCDYFEKLYNCAQKYHSDIALATNIRVGGKKTAKKRLNIKNEKYVSELQDKFYLCKQDKNPCPTNKIYKKSLLVDNNIFFPEGVFCEDKLFTAKAVFFANGVAAVPNIYYYYFRNPNSTVNKKSAKHLNSILLHKNNANLEVLNFLKTNNAKIDKNYFWVTTSKKYYFNIPLIITRENLNYKKLFLLGFIPVFQTRKDV